MAPRPRPHVHVHVHPITSIGLPLVTTGGRRGATAAFATDARSSGVSRTRSLPTRNPAMAGRSTADAGGFPLAPSPENPSTRPDETIRPVRTTPVNRSR